MDHLLDTWVGEFSQVEQRLTSPKRVNGRAAPFVLHRCKVILYRVSPPRGPVVGALCCSLKFHGRRYVITKPSPAPSKSISAIRSKLAVEVSTRVCGCERLDRESCAA